MFAHVEMKNQPFYRHYTVDDGLPSNEVYHVFQDSKGYIWFATNNGVSRFDGSKFENFDMDSGLPDNVVFEIYEDYKGRIWFVTYSCLLSYYENGAIKQYSNNHLIRNKVNNVLGPVKMSFRVDSLDNVTLSVKCFGIVFMSPEGTLRVYEGRYAEGDVVIDGTGGDAILSSVRNGKEYRLVYFDETKKICYGVKKKLKDCDHQIYYTRINDTTIAVFILGGTHIIKGNRIYRTAQINSCIWMSVDRDKNLWASDFSGGVSVYPDANVDKPPVLTLFENSRILSVLHDNEGAYWFSTQTDGVFYVPNYRINQINKENGLQDNRIRQLLYHDNRLYVGFEKGYVDIFKNAKIEHVWGVKGNANSYVRSLYYDSTSNGVLVTGAQHISIIKNGKCENFLKTSSHNRYIVRSYKGGYWVAHKYGIDRYKDGKKVFCSSDKSKFFADVSCLLEDKNGIVWFCTIDGLWRFDGKIFQNMSELDSLLARNSHSMFFHPVDSSLWMATNGLGIVVYEKNGKVWNIDEKFGLKSNTVNDLACSADGVWAATSQGLSFIRPIVGHRFDVHTYGMANGLPSNDITAVAVNNDTIFVGTNKGLAVIDRYDIEGNEVQPYIYVTGFEVDGETYICNGNKEPILLSHSQNNINFAFRALTYRNNSGVLYRYRMVGLDTMWTYTYATSCMYVGLKSGKYAFQVQCQGSNVIWSTSSATAEIEISRSYWETRWFMVLLSLVVTLLFFYIYKLQMMAVKRRNKLIHSANLYKQQSLRQQMNPHFIFNTLGSIQYYILNNDTLTSHRYLTKFAKLMRLTLDNSLTPVISLNDEIESLKTYLDLEMLRLEGKFSYSINCENFEQIKDIKVPTLLIQPFVENSIWHGVMLKPSQEGFVSISIVEKSSSIVISVDDDGVGRAEAGRIREKSEKSGRKSRGYQITQQRINLLNTMYGNKFKIVTRDKFGPDGISTGTNVTITFPKGISFENLDFDYND